MTFKLSMPKPPWEVLTQFRELSTQDGIVVRISMDGMIYRQLPGGKGIEKITSADGAEMWLLTNVKRSRDRYEVIEFCNSLISHAERKHRANTKHVNYMNPNRYDQGKPEDRR